MGVKSSTREPRVFLGADESSSKSRTKAERSVNRAANLQKGAVGNRKLHKGGNVHAYGDMVAAIAFLLSLKGVSGRFYPNRRA